MPSALAHVLAGLAGWVARRVTETGDAGCGLRPRADVSASGGMIHVEDRCEACGTAFVCVPNAIVWHRPARTRALAPERDRGRMCFADGRLYLVNPSGVLPKGVLIRGIRPGFHMCAHDDATGMAFAPRGGRFMKIALGAASWEMPVPSHRRPAFAAARIAGATRSCLWGVSSRTARRSGATINAASAPRSSCSSG